MRKRYNNKRKKRGKMVRYRGMSHPGLERPYFRMTFCGVVGQDANGSVDLSIHYRSLTRFIVRTATGTTFGLVNAPKVKDLWDEYRPVQTTVSWDPLYNTSNGPNSAYVGTHVPAQFLLGKDRDNTGIGNPATGLTQKGTLIKNTLQKWKKTFKHGKYAVTSTSLGYSNVQDEATADYQKGIIYFSTFNPCSPVQPNLELGVLKVVHIVQFKGRTDAHPVSYFGVNDLGFPLAAPPVHLGEVAKDGVEFQQPLSSIPTI